MKNCIFCDAVVATRDGYEMEHFPTPARHGGTQVVVACITCHDMIDRVRLDNWPPQWFDKWNEDWPKLSRESRCYLAKMWKVFLDTVAKRQETANA